MSFLKEKSLEEFKKINFKNLTSEMIKLIKKERQTPNLVNLQYERSNGRIVLFKIDLYKKHKWLAGCHVKDVLYCFWCVLAKAGKNNWSTKGISNINSISKSIKEHEKTKLHLDSEMNFKNLGRRNLLDIFNTEKAKNLRKLTELQDKNRRYMSSLFRITIFLSRQGLAFRGNQEDNDSLNKGNFIELVEFVSFENSIVNEFLINQKNKMLSSKIQNELIEIVSFSLLEKIKKEISMTEFVSIIADEGSDYGKRGFLIIIFRYIYENEIKERFIRIIDISESKSAEAISLHIINTINEFNCMDKIISQCYDGAPVMSGKFKGVQKKIKEITKKAHFIHCMAHKLYLLVGKILEKEEFLIDVFEIVNRICKFFGHSSTRNEVLKQFILKKIPSFCQTKWSYNSRMINFVQTNIDLLVKTFEHFIKNNNLSARDKSIVSEIIKILIDCKFKRKLSLLNDIMIIIQILYEFLQKVNYDIFQIKNKFDEIKSSLIRLKPKYQDVDRVDRLIENILQELGERFDHNFSMVYFEIFFRNKNKKIISNFLNSLEEHYPEIFDLEQLEVEILILKKYEELLDLSPNEIFSYNKKNDFIPENFYQVKKFLNLLTTISFNTANAERGFSSLKKIQDLTRINQTEERLDSLLRIYVERDLSLSVMNNLEELNELVKKFSKKNRIYDFGFIE